MLLKLIEHERINFPHNRISYCYLSRVNEELPSEEGRKLNWLGIPKDCSLRKKMNVVAIWLDSRVTKSFDEIRELLGQ